MIKNEKNLQILLKIIFVLFLISVIFALLSVGVYTMYFFDIDKPFSFYYNCFSFILTLHSIWLLISASSLLLGYKYKTSIDFAKKSFISGIVLLVLQILIICISFIISIPFNLTENIKTERYMDVKFPISSTDIVNKKIFKKEENIKSERKICSDYSDQDTYLLEEEIKQHKNWIKYNDYERVEKILSKNFINSLDEDSYILVYNKTTDEYNTIPSDFGTYYIYNFSYNFKSKIQCTNQFEYTYDN